MSESGKKRLVIMVQAEFFPLPKMNASHKRFHYLCHGLAENNEVLVICPNSKFKSELLEIGHLKVLRVPSVNLPLLARPIFYFLEKRYVKRYLSERKSTDVFIYWYNSSIVHVLGKEYDCRRIWDVMGIVSNELLRDKKSLLNVLKSRIYLKLEKSTFSHTDAITTINLSHKALLKEHFQGTIEVLRDAVDKAEANSINKETSGSLMNKYRARFVITFIGSFDRRRIDDLLEVIPELRKNIPEIVLLVIGEGLYLQFYKDLTKTLGIEEHVNYLGYMSKDHLNAVIQLSDVCFADVFLEGFPFKIFEYAIFGKPIVVKETDSIREVLTNRKNACFYKNNNELIQVISKLHDDQEFRAEVGNNAKLEIMEKHTWDKRIEQLERVFNN
jgi:glycosyltransferase involved in cell wall biosynthesis